MKKIRLNLANSDATEILTRTQLKSIYGGSGSGSGSGSGAFDTGCPSTQSQCTSDKTCTDPEGVKGKCGWTYSPKAKCTCATISFD